MLVIVRDIGLPPEAELFRERMLIQRPRAWHAPQLVEATGISLPQVQNILKGYRTRVAGERVPVRASADDAARIAQVLGISPVELAEHSRNDAAEALRLFIAAESARLDRDGATPLRRLVNIRAEIDALIEDLRVSK